MLTFNAGLRGQFVDGGDGDRHVVTRQRLPDQLLQLVLGRDRLTGRDLDSGERHLAQPASGTPTTQASRTAGCETNTRRTVSGRILNPPRLIAPSALPCSVMNPSASIEAMSVVRIQSRLSTRSWPPAAPARRRPARRRCPGRRCATSVSGSALPTLLRLDAPNSLSISGVQAHTDPANSVAP